MKKLLLQILLLAALLPAAITASAATFVNYYNFSALSPGGPLGNGTNSDGANLRSGLVTDGITLYGAAGGGGGNGLGTIYSLGIDGGGFAVLYTFPFPSTNGQGPSADLALSGGVLYGTCRAGGTNGLGTIFSFDTGAKTFAKLHDFGTNFTDRNPITGDNINSGGAFPETTLVVSGDTLFGATEQGGSGGGGTLFKIGTNGANFTILHNFTNVDGNFPSAHMVVIGTNLFGTTHFGGSVSSTGNGVIFRVNTDGTGFTNLFILDGLKAASPIAGLVLSDGILYGTAENGSTGIGNAPDGSIFKINPDGTGFSIVYIFNPNLDAADPSSGLVVSGNQIYGTEGGFDTFGGVVFQVSTTGTGYTNLTSFNDPSGPKPGLLEGVLLSGGNLYATGIDGANTNGEIFKLTLPPPVNQHLNAQLVKNSIVLTWTNASLSLFSASSPTNIFIKIFGAISPFTNAITGHQQFFEIK